MNSRFFSCAATVFLTVCASLEVQQGSIIWAIIDGVLATCNLYFAVENIEW